MKIEIVVDPSRPPPLSARVTPAPAMNGAQTKYDWFIAYPQSRLIALCDRIAVAAGRTNNPRRRRARKGDRPPKSVADLDAEMEVHPFLLFECMI